ncbi:hypothetical protein NFI96_009398, partial [Prochilodus magdalenae]
LLVLGSQCCSAHLSGLSVVSTVPPGPPAAAPVVQPAVQRAPRPDSSPEVIEGAEGTPDPPSYAESSRLTDEVTKLNRKLERLSLEQCTAELGCLTRSQVKALKSLLGETAAKTDTEGKKDVDQTGLYPSLAALSTQQQTLTNGSPPTVSQFPLIPFPNPRAGQLVNPNNANQGVHPAVVYVHRPLDTAEMDAMIKDICPPRNNVERLRKVIDDHSGIMDEPSKKNLIRMKVAEGLLSTVAKQAKQTCIGWENKDYTDLVAHAKHAEKNMADKEKRHHETLLEAQLMYYRTGAKAGDAEARGEGGTE